jgi:hypothetical protein
MAKIASKRFSLVTTRRGNLEALTGTYIGTKSRKHFAGAAYVTAPTRTDKPVSTSSILF